MFGVGSFFLAIPCRVKCGNYHSGNVRDHHHVSGQYGNVGPVFELVRGLPTWYLELCPTLTAIAEDFEAEIFSFYRLVALCVTQPKH